MATNRWLGVNEVMSSKGVACARLKMKIRNAHISQPRHSQDSPNRAMMIAIVRYRARSPSKA
ncbi:MAG TPA: peptidase dimerization domain-containing protein [Caldilineae bacterium]|nr:peptidase dimerization domain-containing protein [Caldilineae bacterium]